VRVFLAGGTGVIGRRPVPQLVARGHEVTATTTSPAKLGLLARLGAEGIVMDGLDASAVGEAVATARPETVVNQMTALSAAHAGKPDLRRAAASSFPPTDVAARATILRDRDGRVAGTLALDVLEGRIQTIRSVVNPDKLGHVGPVADAWALVREMKQVRRPRT
jgi:NAD(P)H-binding